MTSSSTTQELIHIREASLNDVDVLAQLFQQEAEFAQHLAAYYELAPDFDWDTRAQTNIINKSHIILLAEQGHQTLGLTHLRIVEYGLPPQAKSLLRRFKHRKQSRLSSCPLKPLSYGVIEACFVSPDSRRKGIGNRLIMHALEQLQKKRIQRVELGVLANNDNAQQFWQQLGFENFRVLMHRRIRSIGDDI